MLGIAETGQVEVNDFRPGIHTASAKKANALVYNLFAQIWQLLPQGLECPHTKIIRWCLYVIIAKVVENWATSVRQNDSTHHALRR